MIASSEDLTPPSSTNLLPTEGQTTPPAPSNEGASESCPSCKAVLDVTGCHPLSEIACPLCGCEIKVLEHFGQFLLLSQLGRGGMGAVYRAFDRRLERDIALKLLRNEYTTNPEYRAQLQREAQLTASINHPHVVRVYSVGQHNGFTHIAMEIVSGGTLAQMIEREGKIAEPELLRFGIQMAEGLEAAHRAGLLHRDVKPGNILFVDRETVKVADFGLALSLAQVTGDADDIWGTPHYVAPEKLSRDGEDVRSDIYSLGCTLFHGLAGRPPVAGNIVADVVKKQIHVPAPNVQSFAPAVSGSTAYVIAKMLEKDPAKRYQNYEEVIEHLRYVLDKLESKQTPPKPSPHPLAPKIDVSPGDRKTILWGAAAAVGAATVLLTGSWFLHRSDAKQSLAAADRDFRNGIGYLASGGYADAAASFLKARRDGDIPPELSEWALLCEGLADLYSNRVDEARTAFRHLATEVESHPPDDRDLRRYFGDIAKFGEASQPIPLGEATISTQGNYQAIAYLMLGLKAWDAGRTDEASSLFREFQNTPEQAGDARWVTALKDSTRAYMDAAVALQRFAERANRLSSVDDKAALVDELRKVRGPASAKAAAIAAKLTAGPSTLVSYWNFDETSGDSAANAANPSLAAKVKGQSIWTKGRFGNAFLFTGSNSLSLRPAGALNLTRAITVAGWFRTTSSGDDFASVVRHDLHFNALQFAKRKGRFTVWTGNGDLKLYEYPWDYGDGAWHHFAATYDSTKGCKLYMDGRFITGDDGLRGNLKASENDFLFGRADRGDETYTGALDEIAVWSRALTPIEVADLASGVVHPDAVP